MQVGHLEIPTLIVALIERDAWPTTGSRTEISAESVRAFAPDEPLEILYMDKPPFHTVADEILDGKGLTHEQYAINEIEPLLVVPIGFFGFGSDTVLALDYQGRREPSVIRLQWRLPTQPNTWLNVAASFEEFWHSVLQQPYAFEGNK